MYIQGNACWILRKIYSVSQQLQLWNHTTCAFQKSKPFLLACSETVDLLARKWSQQPINRTENVWTIDYFIHFVRSETLIVLSYEYFYTEFVYLSMNPCIRRIKVGISISNIWPSWSHELLCFITTRSINNTSTCLKSDLFPNPLFQLVVMQDFRMLYCLRNSGAVKSNIFTIDSLPPVA